MIPPIDNRYEAHLSRVNSMMREELEYWPWEDVRPIRALVQDQLSRPGKRLRPVLGFAVAELLNGNYARAYPGAASVEFYHLASLILDDVQDNSAYRSGGTTVHATAGISTAINVAAMIRSLSYHPIHRSGVLRVEEKAELHHRLDLAATRLLLGQSIDIGWHADWYESLPAFPYDKMIARKTGALYEASASMAALISGAPAPLIDTIGSFGARFGALYQMIDDFRDTFGPPSSAEQSIPEDIAAGKPSYPLVVLGSILTSAGDQALATTAYNKLRVAESDESARRWLVEQLAAFRVRDEVLLRIRRRAEDILGELSIWRPEPHRTCPLTCLVNELVDGLDGLSAVSDFKRR
jgi:geranylgeranyl pyrophosphate synthase